MDIEDSCKWTDGKLNLCSGIDGVAHTNHSSGLRKVLRIDPVLKDFAVTAIHYKVPGKSTEYQFNYCPFCGGELIEPEGGD